MSGMFSKQLMETLGYDDNYRSTEDSRRMYNVLFSNDAHLGRFISMRNSAVSVSVPFNPHVAKAVDLTTEAIARASYRSAVAVRRQRALGAHILGLPKEPPALPDKQ